jgi:hypothetical protein
LTTLTFFPVSCFADAQIDSSEINGIRTKNSGKKIRTKKSDKKIGQKELFTSVLLDVRSKSEVASNIFFFCRENHFFGELFFYLRTGRPDEFVKKWPKM